MKKGSRVAMYIGMGGLFIAGFFLLGWVVQLLWNWLMPDITGWKMISYWQAMGLLLLSKILFKGFLWNGNKWGGGRWKSHHWKSKWEKLSPEDRERFKQKMREKCGWYGAKDSEATNAQ